jgi:hypothetical protein
VEGWERSWSAPFACTVKNLHVRLDAAPGPGESVTVVVRKNGVDQTLEVVLNDMDQAGSDPTSTFASVAGDRLSVSVTGSEFSLAESAYVSFVLAGA